MDCPAFSGLDLRTSAIIIAVVGMLHWAACVVPARRFRSEFFILMYVLAGAAGLVSCFLLAGILGGVLWAYWLWIWFTLVYSCVMLVALLIMSAGFVTLNMRRMLWFPAVGILFYLLMLYFICVANAQRRSARQVSPATAAVAAREGEAADATRAGAGAAREAEDEARATRADISREKTTTTPWWLYSFPRGRCALPPQNPPDGEYGAALPNNRLAGRNYTYHRLRLWVFCNQYFRPRYMPHALCYSGGWNRPLPECVRDKTWYEVYYEQDEYEETTTPLPTDKHACLLPRSPQNGYFTRQASISKKRISLVVQCHRLHFLVGSARLACQDGLWDRPMPKCMFISESVCTLLKRTDGMIRTCLASDHYAATYRCDAGIVPHGTVVEPLCGRDHFMWGPAPYMYCLDGMWHPRTFTWHNLTCRHAVDIYRYYETTTTTRGDKLTTTADLLNYEDSNISGRRSLNDSIKNIILKYQSDIDEGDVASDEDLNQEKIEMFQEDEDAMNESIWKSQEHVVRNPRSDADAGTGTNTNETGLWASQSGNPRECSSKPNKINLWESETEHNENTLKTKSKKISIWKPLTSGTSSTSSSKIKNWQSQSGSQSGELFANRSEVDIWKLQSENQSVELSSNKSEISIWKSQHENEGDRSSVSSNIINIWKPQNVPGTALNLISTNILKSQDSADRSNHPNLNKINFKRLRKKAAKWLGAHSGKIHWRKTADSLVSNRTKKAVIKV